MAIISKLIEGLTNDVEHFVRVYPINPEGFAQSELDGQVASAVPMAGLLLSTLAEGAVVMIEENGVAVPFYLGEHNYESGLNGTGSELIVRKEPYVTMALNSTNTNVYENSNVDTLFNGDYLSSLKCKDKIIDTVFPYTKGGTNTLTTLARKVFTLSFNEFGDSNSNVNTEGTAIPIASIINDSRSGYEGTRSPVKSSATNYLARLNKTGNSGTTGVYASVQWRPAFALPANAVVSPVQNADGSYNLLV